MTKGLTLEWVVAVQGRFARSVSLVRDAGRADALGGYILTPTGREVLLRLAEALRGESFSRAWSLTGPYGTGKSAFALFVAHLLGGEGAARKQAHAILEQEDTELYGRLFGAGAPLRKKTGRLCPVLVSGSPWIKPWPVASSPPCGRPPTGEDHHRLSNIWNSSRMVTEPTTLPLLSSGSMKKPTSICG